MLIPSLFLFFSFYSFSVFFSAAKTALRISFKDSIPYLIDNNEISIEFLEQGPLRLSPWIRFGREGDTYDWTAIGT
jgi:hypothetical protein